MILSRGCYSGTGREQRKRKKSPVHHGETSVRDGGWGPRGGDNAGLGASGWTRRVGRWGAGRK